LNQHYIYVSLFSTLYEQAEYKSEFGGTIYMRR